MAAYLIRRLWQMVPTLFGVVLLVFLLFKAFGGDPAEILAGQNASQQQVAQIRQQLGLDEPLVTQFGIFLKQIVTFDWGKSWATNEAVSHLFATRLPATLTVMLPILVLDTLLAIPFAMGVAYVRGSLTDRAIMILTTVALSISFLVYVILGQYVFAFRLGLFPVQGWSDSLWTNLSTYTPLPALLAVAVSLAPTTRLYRSFFLDEIGHDYVRTARAKGLTERVILMKHVLRNAMIPILTNVAVNLPGIFVGSFLIEVFFSIPGLGRELWLAVNRSDYPVIQAFAIYLAVITMAVNLATDLLYKWVDPRVVLEVSAVLPAAGATLAPRRSRGVWAAATARFRHDRVGLVSLVVVVLFLALVIASGLGWVAADWQVERGVPDAPPSFVGPAPAVESVAVAQPKGPNVDISDVDPLAPRYQEWDEAAKKYRTTEAARATTLPFGADRLGRDVLAKAIKGAQVSILVGVSAALLATLIGTLLGAIAGFFGGKAGDFLEWVYNVFTAIPGILLIFAFAAVFGRGIASVVAILGLAGWTGIYRLVRAEFIKHAARDYVRSAEAIGASTGSRMFRHILPNVSHVVLVQLSIHVVAFIKSEVILSYLGLGVGVDQVSWGTMLSEAQSELILGHWWQLAAATLLMAVFVTAFSLMTDALRDALDPKLRGLE